MFKRTDEGRYKSQRVAEVINEMHGEEVEFVTQRIQDVDICIINQYDVLVCAVDNVATRMDLNLMFMRSECKMLIDCGISGYKAHVKMVRRGLACLYCIKDLYEINNPGICTMKSLPVHITPENRNAVLRSMVEMDRDMTLDDMRYFNKKSTVMKIIDAFNAISPNELNTNEFEVVGMYDNIMPNVCFINSICASLVYRMLCSPETAYDFIFYSSEDKLVINKMLLEKDKDCIVCKYA
ncbi:NEDD8-activating protein uba3 [Ordospora colligata]